MKTRRSIFKSEQGSTIIVAMLILVFLTIIGISAISSSIFESQITGNEHRYQIDFYVAESGWKHAALWLESLTGPPPEVNPGGDNVVKNFGPAEGPYKTAPAYPAPTVEDVVNFPDNLSNSQGILADGDGIDNDGDGQIDEAGELWLSRHGIPYWYQIEYAGNDVVSGSSKGMREFFYRTTSNANQTQEIEVVVSKIFKVGY